MTAPRRMAVATFAHPALAALAPLAALALAGCARTGGGWRGSPLGRPALDGRTTVAPGVVHRTLAWSGATPWRADLLEVDLACGATVSARKAGGEAVGRGGTLALVRDAARSDARVAGGVNADFFSFRPAGVPAAAHVEGSRVVAGPTARPVFALDVDGRPWIDTLATRGWVALGASRADTLALTGWNRADADGVALVDSGWGWRTDSVPGRLIVTLGAADVAVATPPAAQRGPAHHRVVRVDSGAIADVPRDGALLVVGASAPPAVRRRLAMLRPGGDTVALLATLAPIRPREAVGGHPILVRDGAPVPGADRTGAPGFHGRNPRTAVGVTRDGRRLLLLTVDGRRAGWSVGMTLGELTAILRGVGAWQALNLDGGGSTTFVVRDTRGDAARAAAATFRIANQPSDSAGERAVANALVVHACRAR